MEVLVLWKIQIHFRDCVRSLEQALFLIRFLPQVIFLIWSYNILWGGAFKLEVWVFSFHAKIVFSGFFPEGTYWKRKWISSSLFASLLTLGVWPGIELVPAMVRQVCEPSDSRTGWQLLAWFNTRLNFLTISAVQRWNAAGRFRVLWGRGCPAWCVHRCCKCCWS